MNIIKNPCHNIFVNKFGMKYHERIFVMKKIFAIAFCTVCAAAVMTACSTRNNDKDRNSSSASSSATTTVTTTVRKDTSSVREDLSSRDPLMSRVEGGINDTISGGEKVIDDTLSTGERVVDDILG